MYRSGRSVIAPFFCASRRVASFLLADRYGGGDSVKTVGPTIRLAPDGGLWVDHLLELE